MFEKKQIAPKAHRKHREEVTETERIPKEGPKVVHSVSIFSA